jgi:hypothetical protein
MSYEPRWYKLIGKLPVPCRDIEEWAEWCAADERKRIVRQDDVGPLRVSTVFLGLDHNLSLFDNSPEHEPLLFETMIFDDGEDHYQTRCTTWDQAELMHEVALAEAKARYERALKALEKREAE